MVTTDIEKETTRKECIAVIDPVCRKKIDPRDAAKSLHYRGGNHFFCSMECARLFAARPQRYAGLAA